MRKSNTLYPHQKTGLGRALHEPFFALFMDQGTGKTPVAIQAIKKRYLREDLHRIVIFAPNHLLFNWTMELRKWIGLPKPEVKVLELKGKGRDNWIAQIDQFFGNDPELLSLKQLKSQGYTGTKKSIVEDNPAPLMIWLINYEKARILETQLRKFKMQGMVLDESQRVKTGTTQTSKAIYRVSRKCSYRLLLSGTPIGKGYEDLFMQYKIMDSHIFGTEYKDFENRYLVKGGFKGHDIVGYQNLEELKSLVHRSSYRVFLDDCVDLPPLSIEYVSCELTGKALKAYEELYEDLYTQIPLEATRGRIKSTLRQYGIPYDPRENYISLLLKAQEFLNITSCELTITKLIRLHQITGGFLKLDTGELVNIGRDKVKLTLDLVKDQRKPLVIFCQFVEELRLLNSELERTYPKRRIVNYRETSDKKGVEEDFKLGKIDILLLQIHSGSVGLNLQRADTIIFYSINHSADDYVQAISRIKRIGQDSKMRVVNLICTNTIDEDIFRGLKNKIELMDNLWDKP